MLKGIIGIGAMAKISSYTGHSEDQSHYDVGLLSSKVVLKPTLTCPAQGLARQYIQQWTSLASGSDQLNLNFGSSGSGLVYNLYADKLLQLNLVDSSVSPFHFMRTALQFSDIRYIRYKPLSTNNRTVGTISLIYAQ